MKPDLKKDNHLGFIEVEHTADWAYRVWAKNLEDLFIQAGVGLYSLAGAKIEQKETIEREINLRGVDPESLLIAWLNELLSLHEMENLAFNQVEITQLTSTDFKAQLTLGIVTEWIKDIKAATYHNLVIKTQETGLEVTIVLDV